MKIRYLSGEKSMKRLRRDSRNQKKTISALEQHRNDMKKRTDLKKKMMKNTGIREPTKRHKVRAE